MKISKCCGQPVINGYIDIKNSTEQKYFCSGIKGCGKWCEVEETEMLLQEDWKEELYELSEKYCQHNDKELNNCLYYIFKSFIESQKQKSYEQGTKEDSRTRSPPNSAVRIDKN